MGACGGAVHAVALLQQFEQLLDRDTRIRRTTQSEDLPEQHPKRPPRAEKGRRYIVHTVTPLCQPCIRNSTQLRSGTFDLHVALVGVDAVKQCLWSHPLHWQSALR